MLNLYKTLSYHRILVLVTILVISIFTTYPVSAQDRSNSPPTTSSTWSLPIKFFQKSLSKADGNRCAMYPSCSHYASKAFKRHGIIKGWILTADRLLRCGHDETRRSPQIKIEGKRKTFDPLYANTQWWRKP